MPVNHNSGRLVVDIDPRLKTELHSALAADGVSLKDWFIGQATAYVKHHRQPSLFVAEPGSPPYETKS